VSFDLEAPFVQDFIRARANQLAGQVTSSTYAAIQQALADGVSQGASIDDLAASVQQVFDVASSSRAKTIARTEVISASNGSASLAAAQLPADVAAGQEWISTRDERTRDDHADADGQVVAMGQPFDVGGEALLYPGDPGGDGGNVINCRCTVAFLTPKDMEGRSRPVRVVPLRLAQFALRTVTVGGDFDEHEFRRSLQEAAA
jgi:SPP1 gp7 family putative phage head morphogenesis protein